MSTAGALLFVSLLFMGVSQPAPSLPRITDLSKQDTFAKAGISPAQQSEIAKLIEENTADWEHSRITQMQARRVSLSPAKMDGLILHSTAPQDCGATGNCLLTVLRRQGSRWQVVLPDAFADGFGISPTTHHGVYDLAVSANESAETGLVRVFAFDGTRYRVSQCFEVREKVAKPAACANTSQ